nr:MAG: hypothetical protein [Microvirus sp.]
MDKKPNPRFPRLDAFGREVLSDRPLVVYMDIDEKTGEVLQEGRPRQMSVQEAFERSVNRPLDDDYYDGYDDEDEIRSGNHGDFDLPEEEGRIPLLSPHQEGFIDRYAPSIEQATKMLLKAGYAVAGPDEDLPIPKSKGKTPVGKKSSPAGAPLEAGQDGDDTSSGVEAE